MPSSLNLIPARPSCIPSGSIQTETMAEGDNHLAMTLELLRRAEKETDSEKRKALETLAEDYREQAEKTRHTGLTVEFNRETDMCGLAGDVCDGPKGDIGV
jgi:hypothetical protein